MSAYLKVEGGRACLKVDVDKRYEVNVLEDQMTEAKEAKTAALNILRDALKKKGRVLMEEGPHDPMPLTTAASMGPNQGAMMRYAIVTPSEVEKLIDTMEKIRFKQSTDPNKKNVYAYVYPKDPDLIVYLCRKFWSSPEHLAKDSRPGTLIHEVSHFLGSEDITYAERKIKVVMGGNFYEVGQPGNAALTMPETHCNNHALLKENANSIEYEFEILLGHKREWNGSCFPCCGERSRDSVCEQSVPEEFAFFLGE